jgi:hypothetical protein
MRLGIYVLDGYAKTKSPLGDLGVVLGPVRIIINETAPRFWVNGGITCFLQ